jgi:hypothetical protein
MYFLRYGAYREPPIPQPGQPSPSPWLTDASAKQPYPLDGEDHLLILHEASIVDFVNFDGLGFVKDRRHVAGFQGHQVREMPKAPVHWMIQRFDLIGLVVHEQPTAYVSENLPRMDELRAAPTRQLDDFEAAGLSALERGEELYVRDRGEERRMLGAVRAARQCLACHGGERGDLLGAFSYRLTRGFTAGR